jgi:copper chaperone
MKKLIVSAALAALMPVFAFACSGCDKDMQTTAEAKPAAPRDAKAEPSTVLAATDTSVTIPVSGMHCDHCISRVKASLAKVSGVKSVHADLEKGQAVVAYEKGKVDPAQLAQAIEAAGFKPGAPVQN